MHNMVSGEKIYSYHAEISTVEVIGASAWEGDSGDIGVPTSCRRNCSLLKMLRHIECLSASAIVLGLIVRRSR